MQSAKRLHGVVRWALCGPLMGLPWWLRFGAGAESLQERANSPMATERLETHQRFAVLLTVEWVAAIALALAWTRKTRFGHAHSPEAFLAYAAVAGALITCTFLWARRASVESIWTRVTAAAAQMCMASVLINLADGTFGTTMLPFLSIAILGWYADVWVVLAANVVLLVDRAAYEVLLRHQAPVHLPHSWIAAVSFFGWIAAVDAVLLWTIRRHTSCVAKLERERDEREQMLYRALHDAVTCLPNRAAMDAHLEESLLRGAAVSCMLVEIDTLRSASEMLGLRGSEELLRAISERLRGYVGDATVSRYDGQTFAVVLTQPHGRPQLDAMSDALLRALAHPLHVEEREIVVNTSIGIASFPDDGRDAETLLLAAGRASEAARLRGRNGYRHASDLHDGGGERRRKLAEKLQRALLEHTLHLVYQPIFRGGREIIAAEVLARWADPEEGYISPAEFIPLAESTGLIVPLSNWVLQAACEQMAGWLRSGSPLERVAVNVSVMQVWRGDFVSTVERTLQATGLPANRLELELTEGALAGDFDVVKRHLQALRRLGVSVAIDDFGTGYSSLGRVRDLDADTLKIDKLFVQGAAETPNGVAVVEAIIDMAHRLNLSVVAEGVETEEQLEMLRGMGCDAMQGFLLARPQAADAIGPSEALRVDAGRAAMDQTSLHLLPKMA